MHSARCLDPCMHFFSHFERYLPGVNLDGPGMFQRCTVREEKVKGLLPLLDTQAQVAGNTAEVRSFHGILKGQLAIFGVSGHIVPSQNDPQTLCMASEGKVKGSLCCRADYSSLGHQRKPDLRAKLYYPCTHMLTVILPSSSSCVRGCELKRKRTGSP